MFFTIFLEFFVRLSKIFFNYTVVGDFFFHSTSDRKLNALVQQDVQMPTNFFIIYYSAYFFFFIRGYEKESSYIIYFLPIPTACNFMANNPVVQGTRRQRIKRVKILFLPKRQIFRFISTFRFVVFFISFLRSPKIPLHARPEIASRSFIFFSLLSDKNVSSKSCESNLTN